jgi:hypothetical protein
MANCLETLKRRMHIVLILSFLKNSFINLDVNVETSTVSKLSLELTSLTTIKEKNKLGLSDDDVSDITLLISVLNEKELKLNDLIDEFKTNIA